MTKPKGAFPTLDGLRGLFLCWVMFVHAPDSAIPGFLMDAHKNWILGVDGFLAISGFLVTRSLAQCAARGLSPYSAAREFLARRISRILPPYYLVLGAILMIAFLFEPGIHGALRETWRTSLGFPFFYANYSIPIDQDRIPILLQPFWSISFQEQFYFLLALAFLGLGLGGKLRKFLFAGGILAIATRVILVVSAWRGQPRGWEYEANLHLAFDSMSWGCLAWLYYEELGALWSTPARARLSAFAILAGLAVVIPARSFWHDADSMAILSIFRAPLLALAVRLACEPAGRIREVLFQSRFLRGIGTISYEAYLVHPIAFAALKKLSLMHGLLLLPVAYPCVWLAGYAFHHGFGRPSQAWLKGRLL